MKARGKVLGVSWEEEKEEPEVVPEMRMTWFKALQIIPQTPHSPLDVLKIVWGTDVFVYQIPLLKLTIALDVLFWWLLG